MTDMSSDSRLAVLEMRFDDMAAAIERERRAIARTHEQIDEKLDTLLKSIDRVSGNVGMQKAYFAGALSMITVLAWIFEHYIYSPR